LFIFNYTYSDEVHVFVIGLMWYSDAFLQLIVQVFVSSGSVKNG